MGAGYLFLAAALWGLLGPVARLAFEAGLSPLEVAFYRAVLAWPLFLLHALLRGRLRVEGKDLPWVLLFGLVGVSLFYGAYQLAVSRAGAALASVLLYTAPAWVALLSWALFREPLGGRGGVALLLTLLGVWLVGWGGEARPDPWGILFGLLSGFSYALYYIFGKVFLPRYETPTLFVYLLPVGALGLLPFLDFHPLSWPALGAVGFLALFSTYGAYLAYYAGLRLLSATRASVLATLEPVVAAGVAYLWWGERLPLWGYLGAALILLAVLLTLAPQRPR
ncbi:DMT family transporter [Thermus filiformis]|uniref:Membrane protein n=1 Tax=Thermus filiformis TaxID=276 RepID=A0A0A2XCB6_THEFI|nr:EamA family transporter [Thermus filiformis]KGQ22814.1 membrane protein [Thermus filiformis]